MVNMFSKFDEDMCVVYYAGQKLVLAEHLPFGNEHGNRKGPLISDVPIIISIYRGFSMAMFDYQGVRAVESQD